MVCTNYAKSTHFGKCYESGGRLGDHLEYHINYTFEWQINCKIEFRDVKNLQKEVLHDDLRQCW